MAAKERMRRFISVEDLGVRSGSTQVAKVGGWGGGVGRGLGMCTPLNALSVVWPPLPFCVARANFSYLTLTYNFVTHRNRTTPEHCMTAIAAHAAPCR